jgi:hypothetical protein
LYALLIFVPNSPRRVAGLLLLISMTITVGISTVIAEAVAQKEPPKIKLNTISEWTDRNGTITKITNNSYTLNGFVELRQVLDNETEGQSENATGIVINNVPGSVRIERSLNSTNTAVVDEARRVGIPGEPTSQTVIVCFWGYGAPPWIPDFHICGISGPISIP